MLISIITITKDDGALLRRNIDSVRRQRLSRDVSVEHLIVNGGQPLCNLPKKRCCTVLEHEPHGIYNAINYGISKASGDVIGVVHGNDFLADNYVLARVADALGDSEVDFVYGDVNFVSNSRPGVVFRHYTSGDFVPSHLLKGFAPPHPSLFIRREVMAKVGPYNEKLKVAADFDLFLRLFLGRRPFRGTHISGTTVNMEHGGLSTKLRTRIQRGTYEKYRSLRDNGFRVSMFKIASRIFFYIRHKKL